MNGAATQPVGILLISAARHQESFASVFSEHPAAILRAVTDVPDSEPWICAESVRLANDLGLPYVKSIEEALARPDVDIVSICTLYRHHASVAMQALEAGKHVLLDKQPIATSESEGRQLAEVAREAARRGLKLTYLHHSLDPAVQRARAQIEAGEIGEPLAVAATMIAHYGPGHDSETDPLSRWGTQYDPHWWGGGELTHFGGYGIAAARYMMDSDATSVFALSGSHFNRLHREAGIEDMATLSISYANGGIGTVTVGRAPNPAALSKGEFSLHVLGTRGIVTADWEEPMFLISESCVNRGRRSGFGARGNTPVIHQFIDDIPADRDPVHGAEDGLADLQVLLASRRSVRERQPVMVPDMSE